MTTPAARSMPRTVPIAGRAVLAACAAGLWAAAAAAQNGTLPPALDAAVADSRKACAPDQLVFLPGAVQRRDLNGDGTADYWLDYDKVGCGPSATYFCGSGGCTQQIAVSRKDGSFVLVHDGVARDIRFETRRGRPTMILELHGSACGKVGAARCTKVRRWTGAAFE